MKNLIWILSLSLLCVGVGAGASRASDLSSELLKGVEHWRQSTVRIVGPKVVYLDPYKVDGEKRDGDLVFVTHTHADHLSIADLKKVMKPGATIIATPDAVAKLKAEGFDSVVSVVPGQDYEVEGVSFTTVPSYNTNKANHPKANNWVGYIIRLNGHAYYQAGDTDVIPEMKGLQVDVAFLPVGGKYTMTAPEAAEAANLIKPRVAVPIHFLDAVGTWADAEKFVSLLDKDITGVILKQR